MADLTNKLTLGYEITRPSGKKIKRTIIFGANNKNLLFDKNKLEEAFVKVKAQYGHELGAMRNPTIKALTWEYYQKENPFSYKGIKDKETEKKIEDEPPLTKHSITLVNPYIENGSSALLLGGSSSGKTTLLVQALKNLLKDHKKRFDAMIICSETLSSLPFENLPKNKRILIFPKFLPLLISFLIKLQKGTSKPKDEENLLKGHKCRYAFLIILDDINELKDPMIDKLILIARNYGISTIVSTQKTTGLSKSARGSVHNNYILGGRNPETREEIIVKYLRGHIRDLGFERKDQMDKWVRDNTEMGTEDRKIIKLNGLNDVMSRHIIKK